MIESMPSLDRARLDEVTPEREEEIREAMSRGRILTTKVVEARHSPNEIREVLEQALAAETDGEAAVHLLTQCIYSIGGLVHLLAHLIPEECEELVDKYVGLAGMAETVESKAGMEALLAELMREAGHDGD